MSPLIVGQERTVVVGAVGMWESRQRFPRTVERVENPGKDSPVCLLAQEGFPPFPSGRHFHSPPLRRAVFSTLG